MPAINALTLVKTANSGDGTPLGHANAAALNTGGGSTSYSYGFFLKHTGASGLQALFGVWDGTDHTTSTYLTYLSSGLLTATANGTGLANWNAAGATTLTAGTWYFHTTVFDIGTATMRVYLNAVQDGSCVIDTSIQPGTAAFRLGSAVVDPTWGFDGQMAMPFKVSQALTPTLITYLYNGGLGRSTAEILAHTGLTTPDALWGFDNPGALGTDSSANANTLTSVFATAPTQGIGPGAPTTATVTGPTAIDVGTASTAYTITLPAPCPGAGLVFTPTFSVFSATASPTTVSFAAGDTTKTFTITSSTAGTGTVSATASGITVTGQSGVVSSAALTAGTATPGTAGATTAGATATNATGGSAPVTVQWYRSTTNGLLGTAVSGQTTTTLADTGLTPGITYYYTLRYTDAVTHVDSNQINLTTTSSTATIFGISGPSSGFVNNASSDFTFSPNGAYTGTITPVMAAVAGSWSPPVLTFSSSSTPQTSKFTPTAAGSGTANGTPSPSLTVPAGVPFTANAQTLVVSPSSVGTNASGTLTYTGQGTKWLTGPPTFAPSGVSGFTTGSITVLSDTSATSSYATSVTTGTETFTDSTSSATATVTVTSSPTTGQLQAYYPTPSLATVYYVITQAGGKAWNGSAFEALNSGHWTTYGVAASDLAGVSLYIATFPALIPSGYVNVAAYIKLGGSAAASDTVIGTATYFWDGTTLTSGAGGGGGSGNFPPVAPPQWLPLSAFGTDVISDGTMRAASGSTAPQIHFGTGDGNANARATGVVNEYINITGGAGRGQSIPIASMAGASGAKDGTLQAGYVLLTPLDTTSTYAWTAIPVVVSSSGGGGGGGSGTPVLLDSGTVDTSLQVPTTTTFYATGAGLTGASGAYTGMSVRFQTAGKPARRVITLHTRKTINLTDYHYFILAASIPGGLLPAPPASGDTFVVE